MAQGHDKALLQKVLLGFPAAAGPKKCMEQHEKSHIAYLQGMDFHKYGDKGCPTQCANRPSGYPYITFPSVDKHYEFECLGYTVETTCLLESASTIWLARLALERIHRLYEHQKTEGYGCAREFVTFMNIE